MEKKVVSPFEYAIMQAVHESEPSKVTDKDLEAIRPQTDHEVIEARKRNLKRQIERIKFK